MLCLHGICCSSLSWESNNYSVCAPAAFFQVSCVEEFSLSVLAVFGLKGGRSYIVQIVKALEANRTL